MMDAMKRIINQRDVSVRMKSYFPPPHSLSLSLSLFHFHSIFLPESDGEEGRGIKGLRGIEIKDRGGERERKRERERKIERREKERKREKCGRKRLKAG